MLIALMLIVAVFIAMAGGLASLGVYRNKLYKMQNAEIQAMHIAEAGVNYYRWHLAHEQEDFFDGTGADPDGVLPNGPYDHSYASPSGEFTGKFVLEITPPATGSTIATIRSTGYSDDHPNIRRTIEVKYGIPSLAHYSFLTNTDVWFGDSEGVSGELHSNGGIRMDGTNDSLVTSATSTYICKPGHGCANEEKPGVWGTGSGSSLWNFPVPSVDFNIITMDIAQIKADAQADGVYIGPSSQEGYHVIFKDDGTFDLYEVYTIIPTHGCDIVPSWNCADRYIDIDINDDILIGNYSVLSNGLVFIEDDVWVEGTVNGRITLVAAELSPPYEDKNIMINNNIIYLDKDGNHILGLIAQKDILIPYYSPDDLEVNAILLAQKGHCFRYYFGCSWPQPCTGYRSLNSITIYGSTITNTTWTWSWVGGDGYRNTYSIYDSHTVFAPPPSFPTTGEYTFISWEEK